LYDEIQKRKTKTHLKTNSYEKYDFYIRKEEDLNKHITNTVKTIIRDGFSNSKYILCNKFVKDVTIDTITIDFLKNVNLEDEKIP
jgi:hypothetical protein